MLNCRFLHAVYQTEGVSSDGHKKFFKKPWASTALMFFAMVLCLPIAWIASFIESRQKKAAATNREKEPLISPEQSERIKQHFCYDAFYGNRGDFVTR
jgi:hypothetical protein